MALPLLAAPGNGLSLWPEPGSRHPSCVSVLLPPCHHLRTSGGPTCPAHRPVTLVRSPRRNCKGSHVAGGWGSRQDPVCVHLSLCAGPGGLAVNILIQQEKFCLTSAQGHAQTQEARLKEGREIVQGREAPVGLGAPRSHRETPPALGLGSPTKGLGSNPGAKKPARDHLDPLRVGEPQRAQWAGLEEKLDPGLSPPGPARPSAFTRHLLYTQFCLVRKKRDLNL